MFKDREEAGKLLAKKLAHLKGEKTMVLAIPRGGIVIGKVISQALACPLDVLVVKKIGAPHNSELAIGALGPDEKIVWNKDILQQLGLDPSQLLQEIENSKLEIRSKIAKFKTTRSRIAALALQNKTVILVDDGMATGATMEAALYYVRSKLPKRIILALPVAPSDAVKKLKKLVTELIVLETPVFFSAVGQFYEQFPQVSDEKVVKLLED